MEVAVGAGKEDCGKVFLRRDVRGSALGAVLLLSLSLWVLSCGFPIPAVAQSQQSPTVQGGESGTPGARASGATAGGQQPERQLPGSVSGTVVVQTGAAAAGAQVQLTRGDQRTRKFWATFVAVCAPLPARADPRPKPRGRQFHHKPQKRGTSKFSRDCRRRPLNRP